MATRQLPSAEELHNLFTYDRSTGHLTWNSRPAANGRAKTWNTRYAGQIAGSRAKDGRLVVDVNGRKMLASRIIWKMVTGKDPQLVDHISGDPTDDRLCNLRDSTPEQNSRNKTIPRTNTSGHVGVQWAVHAGKWRATIYVHKTRIDLGYHDTISSAVAARKAAEIDYGFHPNHGRLRPVT